MLRSFSASSGEGGRSCPSSHMAPAASHALQASEGRAGRHGGDSKRHGQKPRLKRQRRCLQGRVTANPPRQSSLVFLVAGRRQRPDTIHHTDRETQPSPPSHRARGEQEPLRVGVLQALPGCPCAATSRRFCRTAPTVEDSPGTNSENWISISHPVLCRSHVITSGSLHHHPSSAGHRGSSAPPQIGFTEAFKPGRASPTGKGFLASTTCWGQTPGELCPGWTLALKTMMEMSRSNRDALLMVLPHTEHGGATELWMHGSVSCPL